MRASHCLQPSAGAYEFADAAAAACTLRGGVSYTVTCDTSCSSNPDMSLSNIFISSAPRREAVGSANRLKSSRRGRSRWRLR